MPSTCNPCVCAAVNRLMVALNTKSCVCSRILSGGSSPAGEDSDTSWPVRNLNKLQANIGIRHKLSQFFLLYLLTKWYFVLCPRKFTKYCLIVPKFGAFLLSLSVPCNQGLGLTHSSLRVQVSLASSCFV